MSGQPRNRIRLSTTGRRWACMCASAFVTFGVGFASIVVSFVPNLRLSLSQRTQAVHVIKTSPTRGWSH